MKAIFSAAQRFWPKQAWWLMALILSVVLVFLRFYQIQTSLLFFNDIGRDFLELWQWEHTGKPPLLGPQTSAMPFNQSAIYFYVLMPFYLLMQHSLLSTLVACAVIYLVLLWVGAWWVQKHQPKWLNWFWILSTTLIFQPQMIIQHRFVWNPSFVAGWLVLALVAGWQLVATPVKNWRWSWLIVWGLGMSLATSFSYSMAPALVAAFIVTVIWWRWAAWKVWLSVAGGLLLWNLPTAFFELRHGFLLTRMMLFGTWAAQIPSSLGGRWAELSRYLPSPPPGWPKEIGMVVLVGWLLVVGGQLIYQWRQRRRQQPWPPVFTWTASWWLLTVLFTLALPMSVQSHYIFPVLTLGLASLAVLPHWSKWLVLGILMLSWLQPAWFIVYWAPARHSMVELEACNQKICQAVSEPLFVSNQADAHPYHNAMEYQYLLRRAGCDLKDIANFPQDAQTMAVVVDDSAYEQGKTIYNELTLFGKSRIETTISCSSTLQAIILKRL